MIAALLATIAAPLFAFASWIAQPVSATCPRGWYLATGVRIDGSFRCHLRTPMAEWPPMDGPAEPALPGRVWCDVVGDARQDGRRVWCVRRARS